jgi:hypothetical protein
MHWSTQIDFHFFHRSGPLRRQRDAEIAVCVTLYKPDSGKLFTMACFSFRLVVSRARHVYPVSVVITALFDCNVQSISVTAVSRSCG